MSAHTTNPLTPPTPGTDALPPAPSTPPPPEGMPGRRRIVLFVIGGLLLVAGAYLVASDGNRGGTTTSDARADVTIQTCASDHTTVTCVVIVSNGSDTTSDYYIETAFVDPAGTHVGVGNASIDHVGPGQTIHRELTGTITQPTDVTATITTAQRTPT